MKDLVHICVEFKKTTMANTENSRFDTREELEVFDTLRERLPRIGHVNVEIPKSMIVLTVWLAFCAFWIFLSYQSGKMFFDKILLCSLIITCVLFFKTIDDEKNNQLTNKKK